MPDPYHVLGVTADASDEDIKQAYLEHVRRYPPERAPERFQAAREAFERVRTRRDRLRLKLLQPPGADIAELVAGALPQDARQRPGEATFQALLLDSAVTPKP